MPKKQDVDVDLVKKLIDKEMYSSEICKHLGIHKAVLDRVSRNHNLRVLAGRRPKLFGKHDDIVKLYREGSSLEELARRFVVSIPTVRACLASNGVKMRTISESSIKYPFDCHFFDCIDTEQKAYVLGIYFADGYNDEKRSFVSLCLSDEQIVRDVRDVMGSPKRPITNIRQHRKDGYEGSMKYGLYFTSSRLSEQLALKGAYQAKSKSIKFPSAEVLPSYLINHFVRGYFDGDGSVYRVKNTERLGAEIIAPRSMCEEIAAIIPWGSRIRDRSYTDISDLRIGRQSEVRKFRDWMYEDASIFLKRKR